MTEPAPPPAPGVIRRAPRGSRAGAVILWIAAASILAALCAQSARLIDGTGITADAAQNLRMAINLSHQGTISLDQSAPYHESMYREPVPVAVDATLIRLQDQFLGTADPASYFAGNRARYVKYQNVLWVASLWIAAFAATRWLSGSILLAIAAAVYAVKPFLGASTAEGVNELYTELPGVVLLTFGSLALAAAATTQRRSLMISAGVCLALATLVKAATLYVFLVLLGSLAAIWVVRAPPAERPRRGGLLALLAASFVVVVSPWLLRNFVEFGRLQISERGGIALYTRALLDSMTPLEYRGSFYVWARPGLQKRIGSLLGFSPKDLERGGRLQRLSQVPGSLLERHDLAAQDAGRPQDAITFYYQARAMRVRLEDTFTHSGVRAPTVAADGALQRLALKWIVRHPRRHLALVIPLLWRGGLTAFPALLAALIYGLIARRHALVLFTLPGLLTLCFYALLSHFEARPALVVHGIESTSLLVMLQALWRFVRHSPRALSRSSAPDQAALA